MNKDKQSCTKSHLLVYISKTEFHFIPTRQAGDKECLEQWMKKQIQTTSHLCDQVAEPRRGAC